MNAKIQVLRKRRPQPERLSGLRIIDAVAMPAESSDRELLDRATALFPNSPEHAAAWLRSVAYLRTKAKDGWLLDHKVERKA